MLKKLLTLYHDSQFSETTPNPSSSEKYHWYYTEGETGYVGIKKSSITKNEQQLLSTLLSVYTPPVLDHRLDTWYQYLYHGADLIPVRTNKRHRVIQLQCSGEDWDQKDLEQALQGFLPEDIYVFWETKSRAIIIEAESNTYMREEDFSSLAEVLENDLYVRVHFYIGKFIDVITQSFRSSFENDQLLFNHGLHSLSKERILFFEKVFPSILAEQLPEHLLLSLEYQLLGQMEGDTETLSTVQVYLENNLNASVTAKKLYIHRNTLQYRLDKFTEKTGVNLKDFSSALTLYLACLIQSKRQT